MKPADAGRRGQATRKGERMRYYDKLDDYTDTRPSNLEEDCKTDHADSDLHRCNGLDVFRGG